MFEWEAADDWTKSGGQDESLYRAKDKWNVQI